MFLTPPASGSQPRPRPLVNISRQLVHLLQLVKHRGYVINSSPWLTWAHSCCCTLRGSGQMHDVMCPLRVSYRIASLPSGSPGLHLCIPPTPGQPLRE